MSRVDLEGGGSVPVQSHGGGTLNSVLSWPVDTLDDRRELHCVSRYVGVTLCGSHAGVTAARTAGSPNTDSERPGGFARN